MNDMAMPEKAAESFAQSVGTAGQIGVDTVRQVLDRSQTIANIFANFGAESANFFHHRVEQDSKVLGSMVQCRSLPEMLDLEMQWWRGAMDDYATQYASQVDRLMTFNASLMSGLSPRAESRLPVPVASGAAQTKRQAE